MGMMLYKASTSMTGFHIPRAYSGCSEIIHLYKNANILLVVDIERSAVSWRLFVIHSGTSENGTGNEEECNRCYWMHSRTAGS